MALAALSKKAEAEKLQDVAQQSLFALVTCLETLVKPGVQACMAITKNNRENTIKLVRAGGKVDWLDKDSNVVPPD